MNIVVRPANLSDVESIVPFIQTAAGGICEFLLADLVPEMSVSELIEMALMDENLTYHYQNVLVAECNKTIIAASNYYKASEHCLPDILRSLISKEKLAIIEPYINSVVKDSMYIHTLAVSEQYRHTPCGIILGKKIEQIAIEKNMRCLSAHVWRDNIPVYQGLKMAGFMEIEDLAIEPHPDLPHIGGMVLLKGSDFQETT